MNLDRRKSLSFSSKTTIAFSVALCSLVRGLKVFTLVKSEILEMNNILENNNMVFLKCYKIRRKVVCYGKGSKICKN